MIQSSNTVFFDELIRMIGMSMFGNDNLVPFGLF